MAIFLTGDKQLDKALAELKESAANKLLRPAVGKALRIIAKSIRQQVPAKYKDAKRAIGSKFGKAKKKGQVIAKAGSGVGIKFKKIAKQQEKRQFKKKKTGGVGISAANIHWFILGTTDRQTGYKSRRIKGGGREKKRTLNPVAYRGKMPPVLEGIVEKGTAAASQQAMNEMRDTVRKRLAEFLKKQAAEQRTAAK